MAPVADIATFTVVLDGTIYSIEPLDGDVFAVFVQGAPVGRLVYSSGAARGVPEGTMVDENTLNAVGHAWFAAVDVGLAAAGDLPLG